MKIYYENIKNYYIYYFNNFFQIIKKRLIIILNIYLAKYSIINFFLLKFKNQISFFY